ncbi:MAG: hypothetical protein AUK34_14560 [Ignavibacteria bacterium CG2_30_36_16]|nr:hypothetical protein [Ignavibacteria bacterium]OIP54762.1 MAG: hypothetical protein AUK34_14560 [Ignavibacteria bacterium CG2_30_36_16]PJA98979.1 MAG: hypothetical protein CO127_11600 [Ignavibacteria bacterium CG_4_9_14_3_um_filter_36_18]
MQESLVQWTLLNNLSDLSQYLNFKIASKKAQELSTDFGRIDFILEGYRNNHLLVELETTLNEKSKLNYCFDQIINYKNVKFVDDTEYCILYASETSEKVKPIINSFAKENDILVRTYSLNKIKSLYSLTVDKLSLSFGLALPKPANYTICYLRWLNKILKPYYDSKKRFLQKGQLASYFTSPNTTNFRCYLRLALDFEMIVIDNNQFFLTQFGEDYINNFNLDIDQSSNLSSSNLTNEQKKVLLKVLTNSNWTPHKVNIYWFLRFIEVTGGEWLPNIKEFDESKLEVINGLFRVNYKSRTMYEFLNFACNWCVELGLVDKIKTGSKYDRIFLTPLGIEVNNIFSMDLQIKKSRMNLNFKFID